VSVQTDARMYDLFFCAVVSVSNLPFLGVGVVVGTGGITRSVVDITEIQNIILRN
jgi:hypothetical protein